MLIVDRGSILFFVECYAFSDILELLCSLLREERGVVVTIVEWRQKKIMFSPLLITICGIKTREDESTFPRYLTYILTVMDYPEIYFGSQK